MLMSNFGESVIFSVSFLLLAYINSSRCSVLLLQPTCFSSICFIFKNGIPESLGWNKWYKWLFEPSLSFYHLEQFCVLSAEIVKAFPSTRLPPLWMFFFFMTFFGNDRWLSMKITAPTHSVNVNIIEIFIYFSNSLKSL